MGDPKHISKGLEKGLEKFQEFAIRMSKTAAPESSLTNIKVQDTSILHEFQNRIDELHPADRKIWDAWTDRRKVDTLGLLRKVSENRFFGKSKPPVNLTFLVVLGSQYDNGNIARKLNKAYLWLVSNPGREKTNYRRFIMNFMEDVKYENR